MPVVRGSLSAWLEEFRGSTVDEIVEVTQPWDTGTRTLLVSFERGDPVIVQWADDRTSMARRLRMGRQLSQLAPWLPITEVLGGDA